MTTTNLKIQTGIGPLGYASVPTESSQPSAPTLLTTDQLKANFEMEGKTFSSWAEARGYRREDVYRVINGLTRCRRGKVHQIAVELGLKAA